MVEVREGAWAVDLAACTGCGICFDVCDYGAIAMTHEMPYPEPVSDACTACLACEEECPFEAIAVA